MYKINNYKLVVQMCMFIKATLNWGPQIETANSVKKFHFFQLEPAEEVGVLNGGGWSNLDFPRAVLLMPQKCKFMISEMAIWHQNDKFRLNFQI